VDYPRFNRHGPNQPLDNSELAALDQWLEGLNGEGVMSLDGMDGYLTALLVGPATVLDQHPSADWLPAIWGGDGEDGAPFPSNQKRKRTAVLVLRHLQAIATQLREAPDDWQPIFSVADDGEREWADACDWCTGFLQATDLDPDGWEALFGDPALGPLLAPIVLLGSEPPDEAEARDDLSRAAADAVIGLLELRG
jgi:uncharacterized protein